MKCKPTTTQVSQTLQRLVCNVLTDDRKVQFPWRHELAIVECKNPGWLWQIGTHVTAIAGLFCPDKCAFTFLG